MKKKTGFEFDGDRYAYDFGPCSADKGWAQIDTTQDASYYGAWARPSRLQTFEFAEGDLTLQTAESDDEYRELLRSFESMGCFRGIDDGAVPEIRVHFERLGLTDLLHENRRPKRLRCAECGEQLADNLVCPEHGTIWTWERSTNDKGWGLLIRRGHYTIAPENDGYRLHVHDVTCGPVHAELRDAMRAAVDDFYADAAVDGATVPNVRHQWATD